MGLGPKLREAKGLWEAQSQVLHADALTMVWHISKGESGQPPTSRDTNLHTYTIAVRWFIATDMHQECFQMIRVVSFEGTNPETHPLEVSTGSTISPSEFSIVAVADCCVCQSSLYEGLSSNS